MSALRGPRLCLEVGGDHSYRTIEGILTFFSDQPRFPGGVAEAAVLCWVRRRAFPQPQPASLVNGPSYRGYQGASPPAPALSVVPAGMVCAVCADLPLGELLSLSIGTEAVDDVVDLLLFE